MTATSLKLEIGQGTWIQNSTLAFPSYLIHACIGKYRVETVLVRGLCWVHS